MRQRGKIDGQNRGLGKLILVEKLLQGKLRGKRLIRRKLIGETDMKN